ncbi:uncharacterized protein [Palaemon carinicauda]|uniref:uncharacterized protein n=1 Tax=Palaemon carinicauda TaxID=392227 RepID=UPI0035B60AD2
MEKDGSLCPCGDYKCLNTETETDHYPLPNIADITSFLHKAKNGFVFQNDICNFDAKKVSFSGHRITPEVVSPLPEKRSGVQNFPVPLTIEALQEFLGMKNYYNLFLTAIATTLALLNASLKGVGTFPQPQRCFAPIQVDVVGPLPTSQGHYYLFTVIGRSSHWLEGIRMQTAMSASCTSSLLSGE